jgi:cell division septation protein DedD
MARAPQDDDLQFDGRRVVDLSPAEEDWDEPQREKRGSGVGKALLLVLAGLLLVGAGMGAGWLFYSNQSGLGAGAPLVRAPQDAIKVRPEDPGGMEVPDTDKGIYDVVSGAPGEPRTEKLLDAPERPQLPESGQPLDITAAPEPAPPAEPVAAPPPIEAAPAPVASGDEAPVPSAAPIGQVASADPPPPASAAPAAEQPAAPAETATEEKQPEPAPAKPAGEPVQLTKTKPAPAPAAPAATASTRNSWRVQVGALRSEAEAEKEFARLQRVHPDLLGSLSLSIMKVDITGKGTFFRMRAGPLDSRDAAAGLCNSLKAQKVGCLLVRPGS